MKKIFTLFLILVIGTLIVLGVRFIIKKVEYQNYTENVKKGWYVEILNDQINVRELPDRYSNILKSNPTVYKGEVYEAIDYNLDDPNLYWYQIKFQNGTKGWIACNTSGTYLKDYNNPVDIAIPIIKFKEDTYHVVSIKDIKYDHLELWDDKDDYEVTHKIYHEVDPTKNIDQYWIKYTITDGSNKSSSKTQKIIFEKTPSEEDVLPFSEFNRD